MDWASWRVLSWRLSNTLTTDFCIEAVSEYNALRPHSSLDGSTPDAFYFANLPATKEAA